MKLTKSTVLSFILLVIAASMYRVWEGRPFGFAPQLAMAIFGGAVIRDKRLAFVMPLASMLISDLLYQALYINGLSTIKGFYQGQWINYLIFAGITVFGFLMKKINLKNIIGFSLGGSVLFFLVSNFTVWLGGGGLNRPFTFPGLIQCYADAIAFHKQYGLIEGFAGNFVIGDLFFSLLLFGSYYFINKYVVNQKTQPA